MATFASLAEAQTFFEGDRFATLAGMKLDELSETHAVCSMAVTPDHCNALGGVMGGAIFTLADLASAVLANHLHRPTVAQQVSTSYLNSPRGSRLIAEAACLKNGRTSIVLSVDVRDDTGRDVARLIFTSFKLNG